MRCNTPVSLSKIDWDISSDYLSDEGSIEPPVDQYISTKARISLEQWSRGIETGASTYRIERRINRELFGRHLLDAKDTSKWMDSSHRLKKLLREEGTAPSKHLRSLMQKMGVAQSIENFAEHDLERLAESVEIECNLVERDIASSQAALAALQGIVQFRPEPHRRNLLPSIKTRSKRVQLLALQSQVQTLERVSKSFNRLWKDIQSKTSRLKELKERQLLILQQMNPESFWNKALRFVGSSGQ